MDKKNSKTSLSSNTEQHKTSNDSESEDEYLSADDDEETMEIYPLLADETCSTDSELLNILEEHFKQMKGKDEGGYVFESKSQSAQQSTPAESKYSKANVSQTDDTDSTDKTTTEGDASSAETTDVRNDPRFKPTWKRDSQRDLSAQTKDVSGRDDDKKQASAGDVAAAAAAAATNVPKDSMMPEDEPSEQQSKIDRYEVATTKASTTIGLVDFDPSVGYSEPAFPIGDRKPISENFSSDGDISQEELDAYRGNRTERVERMCTTKKVITFQDPYTNNKIIKRTSSTAKIFLVIDVLNSPEPEVIDIADKSMVIINYPLDASGKTRSGITLLYGENKDSAPSHAEATKPENFGLDAQSSVPTVGTPAVGVPPPPPPPPVGIPTPHAAPPVAVPPPPPPPPIAVPPPPAPHPIPVPQPPAPVMQFDFSVPPPPIPTAQPPLIPNLNFPPPPVPAVPPPGMIGQGANPNLAFQSQLAAMSMFPTVPNVPAASAFNFSIPQLPAASTRPFASANPIPPAVGTGRPGGRPVRMATGQELVRARQEALRKKRHDFNGSLIKYMNKQIKSIDGLNNNHQDGKHQESVNELEAAYLRTKQLNKFSLKHFFKRLAKHFKKNKNDSCVS